VTTRFGKTRPLSYVSAAGFEPASPFGTTAFRVLYSSGLVVWRHVVLPAFATTLFVQTSTCSTMLTQSRVSPETKRAIVSNTASEKPPTFSISGRPVACVVP